MTGQALQRKAIREQAIRIASQAMVTAKTPAEVVAGTRAAVRRVDSGGTTLRVELVRPSLPPGFRGIGQGPGEFVAPLHDAEASMVFHAPTYELQDLREVLESLADQAALALNRIDLMESGRVEERERYFRTLVLTSTDVILISRDGRIEYATPSAQSMFGRDVVGESFDDVVHPSTDEPSAEAVRWEHWPDTVLDGTEAVVRRPDGEESTVLVHRRDLVGDPTVEGVVTTLRDVTEERALKRDLAYRASHDEMTGLANSRAWGEAITAEGERRRPGEGIGVVFIDLDNFKQINDRFGHPVGDQVLAEVARRFRECLRAGDVAARVGGDEFAALLRGLSTVDDARAVAQRLATELARPTQIGDLSVECQASIGLSYTEGREQVATLVRQADTALYAAKEQGKGRWTEFNAIQWRPSRATPGGVVGGSSEAGAQSRTIR
jgi:diguanylate cyclase (GGDEF)-like protein/PAS domain S-box-containing protein